MSRAPVLPSLVQAARDAGTSTYAGDRGTDPDDYSERLVKYIPAEVIALFLPFASVGGIADGQLVAALAIGEVLALLWALDRNAKLDDEIRRPRSLVILWSMLAFPAWAVGTSSTTQHLLGWPTLTCALILTGAAALIPKLDDLLCSVLVQHNGEDG